MDSETPELNESDLDATAQKVMAAFAARPTLAHGRSRLYRPRDGGTSVVIEFASPTGDDWREASIWIDERGNPSIAFAGWHTHADLFEGDFDAGLSQMLQFLERILADRVLLEPSIVKEPPYIVLDLDDEYEVLDTLTHPRLPLPPKYFSWSGAGDVRVDELRARFESRL